MAKEPVQIDAKLVGRLSLKTLTWLRDRQIPAVPIAYSVAYEYNHSVIEELVKSVDKLDQSDELNLSLLDQLFREYVLSKYLDFAGFSKTVNDIVEDTGEAVVSAREQLREFKEFLNEIRKHLSENTDESKATLLQQLHDKTSLTFNSIDSLERHLSSVMADMRVLQKKISTYAKRSTTRSTHRFTQSNLITKILCELSR